VPTANEISPAAPSPAPACQTGTAHISETSVSTSLIVELFAIGSRNNLPFHSTYLFITSLRTKSDALQLLVLNHWSI